MPRSPPVPYGQLRRFGFKAVRQEGEKWYTKHLYTKYITEVFIDMVSLQREYPIMVQRLEQSSMTFVFTHPTECNLHLVYEFYANWGPQDQDHEVKVCSKVVRFTAADINDFLGVPEAGTYHLRKLIVTPPYAHIRNLLCSTPLTARWIR